MKEPAALAGVVMTLGERDETEYDVGVVHVVAGSKAQRAGAAVGNGERLAALRGCVAGALILVSASAGAEQSDYEHGGLYLRGSAGASRLWVNRTVAQVADAGLFGEQHSEVASFTPSLGVEAGAFVASRVAVAGAVYFDWVRQAVIELGDGSPYPLGGGLYFLTVAPEAVVYRTLDGGFYFALGAGLAGMWGRTAPEAAFDRVGGVGAGVHLNVGYDWWVARHTGVGLMLRARFAQVGTTTRTEFVADVSEENRIAGVTLAATLLQH